MNNSETFPRTAQNDVSASVTYSSTRTHQSSAADLPLTRLLLLLLLSVFAGVTPALFLLMLRLGSAVACVITVV